MQTVFENTLDDFNVRIEGVPETENLIDFTHNIGFADMTTDMEGFEMETEEVATLVTYSDKFYADMMYVCIYLDPTQPFRPMRSKRRKKPLRKRVFRFNSTNSRTWA